MTEEEEEEEEWWWWCGSGGGGGGGKEKEEEVYSCSIEGEHTSCNTDLGSTGNIDETILDLQVVEVPDFKVAEARAINQLPVCPYVAFRQKRDYKRDYKRPQRLMAVLNLPRRYSHIHQLEPA